MRLPPGRCRCPPRIGECMGSGCGCAPIVQAAARNDQIGAARLEIINKPSATQNGGYGAEARSWRVMVARLRSRGRVCALSHVRGARRRAQAR
jgi:hypothetical protein